ncbi:MAG: hypothetical protein SO128_07565 [Clostridium cadaveris]|uniref:hypothetical protein n=1 Tax=Clostridium cadaveris TaxID=1529 RepID=UPI001459A581|nr:hypothetical protein [Clostridium cadaveris]MDY4949214.1 hypothetical protein [Clostridium cadaveris]NME66311.1 hypothetical protein [Clostridium cadaveris]
MFVRKIKKFFISENSVRNISILSIIFYILNIILFKNKIIEWNLELIVNGDLFNIAGVLAGFIFTGLGFIITSDSKFIKDIKMTNNFVHIKKFYIFSIYYFVTVIILYLLKPCIFNVFLKENIFYKQLYFLFIVQIFVTALILFVISLYILNLTLTDQ